MDRWFNELLGSGSGPCRTGYYSVSHLFVGNINLFDTLHLFPRFNFGHPIPKRFLNSSLRDQELGLKQTQLLSSWGFPIARRANGKVTCRVVGMAGLSLASTFGHFWCIKSDRKQARSVVRSCYASEANRKMIQKCFSIPIV